MGRTAASRKLYDALRALESSARTARSKRGERYSRRDLAERTGHTHLNRRLPEWLDDDYSKTRVPSPALGDQLMAAVRLWSEWAGVPVNERHWADLLEQAQPVRDREPVPRTAPDGGAPDDPHRVFPGHEVWIEQDVLPARLLDREDELRELADFCTAPDTDDAPRYTWWQSGPWAGKSALLAELVVRRRPADVDIASCFIGDRFGNNDRDSFLQTVNRQLAVLAGLDPASCGSRAEEFPGLCAAAAEACRGRGRRLVLVVDGLDEDRGAGPTGSAGLSIAALLPRNPPAGMRVIVAGRPNPPVPDEVRHDHPLREARIVRPLSRSPHGTGIGAQARYELRRLLAGPPLGCDLLGLVTVSQGGLTADDLAELVGAMPYQVEALLRGVTGRSFLPGDTEHARAAPDRESVRRTQVLGHTELYREALTGLGEAAVARYAGRLHDWADEYAAKGWPGNTPSYLMYDYTRLLRRSPEALDRLTAVVLDPYRQRALVDRSSVDTALSEVELACLLMERKAPVDITFRAACAASREVLTSGARALPPSIPVAVALLGQPQRAMNLALTSPYPEGKAVRLAKVARALAGTDDASAVRAAEEAARWADRARGEAAPWNGDEADAEGAAGDAAAALIAVGRSQEGLRLLGSLRGAVSDDETFLCRMTAEASVAARPQDPALAEELLDRAEAHAEALVSDHRWDPSSPVTAWEAIADAAGPTGRARAARMRARISEYAGTEPAGLEASTVRAEAASALVADRPDEAASLARQAADGLGTALRASDALSPNDASYLHLSLPSILTSVAHALVATGSVDDARRLVASVPDGMRRGWLGTDALEGARAAIDGTPRWAGNTTAAEALARQAVGLAEQGDEGGARLLLDQAWAAFSPAPGGGMWEIRLVTLCGALASSGMPADGERLARSLRNPAEQVRALAAVAVSLAASGYPEEARRLAQEAADLACGALGEADDPGAKGAAAQALAHAGDLDRALALAGETGPATSDRRRRTVLSVAAGLRTHDPATTARLIDRERHRLRTERAGPRGRYGGITALGHLIAALGEADGKCRGRLLRAVKGIWSQQRKGPEQLLHEEDVLVVVVLARGSRPEEARHLLAGWERHNRSDPSWPSPITGLALAHAALGDLAAARQVVARHRVPLDRAEASAAVAAYLAGTPAGMWSNSDSSDTEFTEMLRSLALAQPPPLTAPAADEALGFAADALAGDGWHHALPALARVAPEAVRRVRDIVFAHRRLERAD